MVNEMIKTLFSGSSPETASYSVMTTAESGEEEYTLWGDSTDAGTITIDDLTLPGIPTDILATYPYAIIYNVTYTGDDGTTSTYSVVSASTSEWCYYEGVVFTTGDMSCGMLSDSNEWVDANDSVETSQIYYIDLSYPAEVIYANHDVYYVESLDTTNYTYTKTANVYFTANNTAPDDGGNSNDGTVSDKYIFNRETIVGLADEARRLGNVTGELTIAQMKEIFAGVTAS